MGFLKTTAIGGVVFLVPFVIVAVILGKAFQLVRSLVVVIEQRVPSITIGDFLLLDAIAIAGLCLLCFLAGLIARSGPGHRLGQKIDQALMASIPGYSFVKGITDNLRTSEEQSGNLVPVLAHFDDNAQIAFEVERTPGGEVVLYLPGCPDPWSGAVVTMAAERVESIALTVSEALRTIRMMGRGTSELIVRPAASEGSEQGEQPA